MKIKTKPETALLVAIIVLSLIFVPSMSKSAVAYSLDAADDNLNVILLIGDGMGFEHVQMAEWVEYGTLGSFDFRNLTTSASMTTYSADEEITDSAASGTAIACGVKTNNGYLGVDPATNPLQSIVEIAQIMNKSTGLISTTSATHATPAAFYAHHTSRYDYAVIESQMINSGVDILMGGGTSYFDPSQISELEGKGYSLVYNRTELLSEASDKIVGLFGYGYMDIERTRDYDVVPSLAEMTQVALDKLSTDEDGFFLMVEGAQIDLEAHDNDKLDVILETIAFSEAVTLALDFAKGRNDTIVIITADHETGGLTVLGESLNSTLPAEKATEEEKRALRIERADMITVSWSSTYHTADRVPFYAYGEFFNESVTSPIIDNTDIFYIMQNFYNDMPYTITEFSKIMLIGLIPVISGIALITLRKRLKLVKRN